MKRIWSMLKDLRRYPSAIVGLVIVFALIGVSIYTLIALPYNEAIRLWRGSEQDWYNVPKLASPAWFNLFTAQDRPETIIVNSQDEAVEKTVTVKEETTEISIPLTFDYRYEGFPQEITVFLRVQYEDKAPFVSVRWLTPTGEEIRVGTVSVEGTYVPYRVSQDSKLQRRLGGEAPEIGLFADPDSEELIALQGTYTMQVSVVTFEPESDLDAELVLYGQVHGLAGTDHRRRDLMIALLWGTPIALTFGLVAAVFTTGLTMVISGVATWFGGWVDEIIQRVTEVNMVLPFLPILQQEPLAHADGDHPAEHLYRIDQDLPGHVHTGTGVCLYRGCPGVRRQQCPPHLLLPDPATHPHDHPSASGCHPWLCLSGGGACGSGVGRSRSAHLGQDH